MNPPITFTLFPTLPTELRNKIWIHTVDWRSHVLPRPPIPELAVCHEARRILLEIYRPWSLPVPKHGNDEIGFGLCSSLDKRWVEIHGIGERFPRSLYANYESDVLYMNWAIWDDVREGELLTKFLVQEVIDNVQHIVIMLDAWTPIILGGPVRLVGAAPPPPKPDAQWVLTSFASLTTLSFAKRPIMRIDISPLTDDEIRRRKETGRIGRPPDFDTLKREKLALRSRLAEGKILVPVTDPANFENPYFKLEEAKEWMGRRSRELPGWSAPEVQYATIIPDPGG